MGKRNEDFFANCTNSSKIKIEIVFEYFKLWASVMTNYGGNKGKPIAYIDLFCGQGLYRDGTKSIPILILEEIEKNPIFCNTVQTYFNDENPESINKLKTNCSNIDFSKFKYPPDFSTDTITIDTAKIFDMSTIPILALIDPFGYKGLTKELISKLINSFGCDILFFFNYNRVNAALNNTTIKSPIMDIFGDALYKELRTKIKSCKTPSEREKTVFFYMKIMLSSIKGIYNIGFRIFSVDKNRTSHFLILATKHQKGYNEMKKIMHNHSYPLDFHDFCYQYNPHSSEDLFCVQNENEAVSNLAERLHSVYINQSFINRTQLYEKDTINSILPLEYYTKALSLLENNGNLEIVYGGNKARVINSFGDKTKFKFI